MKKATSRYYRVLCSSVVGLAICFSALSPQSAHGDLTFYYPVDYECAACDWIAVVRVDSCHSFRDEELGGAIRTLYSVRREVAISNAVPATFTFVATGGRVDETTFRLPGEPLCEVGQRLFVVLRRTDFPSYDEWLKKQASEETDSNESAGRGGVAPTTPLSTTHRLRFWIEVDRRSELPPESEFLTVYSEVCGPRQYPDGIGPTTSRYLQYFPEHIRSRFLTWLRQDVKK